MKRVLVLFAHPALEKSRVNRRLIEAVVDLPQVEVHDLYEAYPDFAIDVRREQELASAADVIVLQHPFFWYSAPALLKEWQDLVLEHGWAYGRGGTALHGKCLINALSAGGGEASYQLDGGRGITIRQLLAPFEQTARLCGMRYLPPFVVYGTHALDDDAIAAWCGRYRRMIAALRDEQLDVDEVAAAPTLNPYFSDARGADAR